MTRVCACKVLGGKLLPCVSVYVCLCWGLLSIVTWLCVCVCVCKECWLGQELVTMVFRVQVYWTLAGICPHSSVPPFSLLVPPFLSEKRKFNLKVRKRQSMVHYSLNVSGGQFFRFSNHSLQHKHWFTSSSSSFSLVSMVISSLLSWAGTGTPSPLSSGEVTDGWGCCSAAIFAEI